LGQAEIVVAIVKLYKLAQSAWPPGAGACCRARYAEGASS
jgi:hypothetical protein